MTVTAIVSLEDVKDALNDYTGSAGNDAELQQFIDAMSDVVEYIAGPVRSQQFVDEWHSGGSDTILLYNRPLISVDSVTEYSGVVSYTLNEQPPGSGSQDAFGYFVRYDLGTIQRVAYGVPSWFASLPWWTQRTPGWVVAAPTKSGYGQGRVKVTYTAGRATVPAYIKRATLELIRINYQQTQQAGRPAFRGSGMEDQLDPAQMVMGYLVPNRVKELLAPARQAGSSFG